MNFWIDIEDSAGNKVGAGPIKSAVMWENVSRLDSAGTFSFSMSASDPHARHVQAKRIARCRTLINGAITDLGAGIIDHISPRVDTAGMVTLEVSGDDLLREITQRSVGFLALADSLGSGVADALVQVLAFAPSGWTLDTVNGYGSTTDLIYAQFAGESVLNSLVKITEASGEHFRLGDGRKVVWLRSDQPASGLRAVQFAGESNTDACVILSLEEVQETYDLCTRIYPFGSGIGEARLTLAASDRTAPVGYTLDRANNCLIRDASETSYGRIDRYLSFKELTAISNTDADMQSAANALFDAAYTYLARHSQVEKSYAMQVAKVDKAVYPGQTLRVVYRKLIDGYKALDIDRDLVILETTRRIDSSGIRTSGFQVATIDRFPDSDVEAMASRMDESRAFEAHPQLNANSYVTSYREPMDNSKAAQIDFWLGKEVLTVNQVAFRFRIAPLRSTVKSITGQSSTSSSGGGGTQTSNSGGGGTQTSNSGGSSTQTSSSNGSQTVNSNSILQTTGTLGSHVHTLDLVNEITSVEGSHAHSIPGHSHTVSTSNHSHSVSTPEHTHDVSVPSHSHSVSIPDHSHTVTPSIATVYGLYEESSGNTLVEANLVYQVNNGAALGRAVDIGGGWYELDITASVCNSQTFRPLQTTNQIKIQTSTAKTATITGQMVVRTVIQAIALI